MLNPKKAIAAINNDEVSVAGYTVYPITLGLCALLEEIASPLLSDTKPGKLTEWAETVYVMTHKCDETRKVLAQGKEAFHALAMELGDELPIKATFEIIKACQDQVAVAMGVVPDAGDDEEGGQNPLEATDGLSEA